MANLFSKKFMKVSSIPFSHIFREMGRNAFVDWILILIFNFVVLTAMLIFGVYLYWQISTGQFISADTSEIRDEKVFDKKDLDTVVNIYESRKDNSEQIKRGYRGPSDPSL